MMHYNSNNNAYCRAVNAETFQIIEHNPVWISILLYTRNPYSYSHFEIVICIYSVRGDIDQMSTNTFSYTICSAPNVYILVYILIETRIAPLSRRLFHIQFLSYSTPSETVGRSLVIAVQPTRWGTGCKGILRQWPYYAAKWEHVQDTVWVIKK